jgi:hypothetical protein
MADSHPYISGAGNVVQAINHLRKSFPGTVTADTLKKLGIASNNESYVINTLRFVGVLDDSGKKTPAATKAFSQHEDDKFSNEFGALVKAAYQDLFDVHGDSAWGLDKNSLITFFRNSDDTSAVIGSRQAGVFLALAGLAGHGDIPSPKKTSGKAATKSPAKVEVKSQKTPKGSQKTADKNTTNSGREVGLTVRIEINLPADGNQETYDRIFKSIRENLLNA